MKKWIFLSLFISLKTVGQSIEITPSAPYNIKIIRIGMGLDHRDLSGTIGVGTYVTSQGAYIQTHTNHPLYFSTNNSAGQLTLSTAGNLGIGIAYPNAPLQFSNTVVNRKLVLYEAANNDHQFYGFGINGSTLRYQVDVPTSSHVFYAGTSTTTSKELMRIRGDGNVGIGTDNPLWKLTVVGIARITSGLIVDGAISAGNGLSVGGGESIGVIRKVTVTEAFDDVPANSAATKNFTVAGVSPGDNVMVNFASDFSGALDLVRVYSGINKVYIRFRNASASNVTIGSITMNVTVIR